MEKKLQKICLTYYSLLIAQDDKKCETCGIKYKYCEYNISISSKYSIIYYNILNIQTL